MSQYGEPWARDGRELKTNRFLYAATFTQADDLDRAVSCVNALAGVPVPEELPELMLALRALFAAEDKYDAMDKGSADMEDILDLTARIGAAGARVRSAFNAMMGETT